MKKNTLFLLIVFLLGLILFDAAQQKYYIDNFSPATNDPISFLELLNNQFIRWAIWTTLNVPFCLLIWKYYFKEKNQPHINWIVIGLTIGLSTIISLVLISTHSILSQNVSLNEFGEFFQFFIYQKGLTFLLATIMLTLVLFNYSKVRTISKQSVEITNLKKTTHNLQEALAHEETPHLNVKTGYKLKPIPLDEIIWIQSDDYCVKVHTHESCFTLRQSLKALEEKLSPFRFIRIHRTALLNLDYLDQINSDTSKIMLTNKTEIPYSKTGIRSLKEKMKDQSV
ncbi:LytR/AlgR family response regulator transcription factor [Ekhidna sp.]